MCAHAPLSVPSRVQTLNVFNRECNLLTAKRRNVLIGVGSGLNNLILTLGGNS